MSEPTFEKHDLPEPEPEKKTVTVNADALAQMMKDLETLKKDNEMLKSVADVGRVSRYQAQHGKPQPKVVRISRYPNAKGERRFVLAWTNKADEVYQDPVTRVYHEKQDVELIFDDNTTSIVPLKHWALNAEKIEAEIQSATTDMNGQTTYVVTITGDEATKGQKLTIGSVFVN